MKQVKLNNNIIIGKCQSILQRCSYCERGIGKGKICLMFYVPHYTSPKIWIHINCIDKFAKDIIKFKKKHIRDIMIESLTEKR